MLFLLPEDVLYLILSYLDCKALARLFQVCKALHRFSARDVVWRRVAKSFINTGVSCHGADVYQHIPLKERLKLSQNWSSGFCRKQVLLRWRTYLLPWIQLDRELLYVSQAAEICAYHLHSGVGRVRDPQAVFAGHQEDICKFILTQTHVISAGGDGKVIAHERATGLRVQFCGHGQEVNCVDSKGGIIVSGSRDRTARIWGPFPNSQPECLHTIPLLDRVWSVAINPALSTFVTGTACCENYNPLCLWDIERAQLLTRLGSRFRRGAGVLGLLFESPFQLLSCGHDTYIRSWDIRCSPRSCVMEWEEPHDCALYCVQSDGNHMIASGSSHYGVVRLWDKRQTQCLQMFQLSPATSSPVYCLCFDASHLYAALAKGVYALDFRGHVSRVRR